MPYDSPPYPEGVPNYNRPSQYCVLGTGKKPAVFRNGGIGREYNLKKPYLGLKMGDGIGREAVLGGAILGGTTVSCIIDLLKFGPRAASRIE